MRKCLLFRWNYPLRWYVKRVGLSETHRDGTPNMILMVKWVMRQTGCKLSKAYKFCKEIR